VEACVVKHVSFIDCPGHAELMGTAMSGMSVLDAALFVVDSNVDAPSPQALSHIKALAATNNRLANRVACIQTKGDLLKSSYAGGDFITQALREGADAAREALQPLMGADDAQCAPVFPVATLQGLGLHDVCKWIASLPDPNTTLVADPVMTVLRKFDINKPGTHPENAKGIVLGGMIRSGNICVGDQLELRPGRFTGGDGVFKVQPVQVGVEAMQSVDGKATVSMHRAQRGGLFALQTSACPSLLAEKSFVASVLSKLDVAPPVWQQVTLQLVEGPLLEDGQHVRLHAGSAQSCRGSDSAYQSWSAEARVSEQNALEVTLALLDRPLCIANGSTLIIERLEGKSWIFCTHGKLIGGERCLDGADPPLPLEVARTTWETRDLAEHFVDALLLEAKCEVGGEFIVNEDKVIIDSDGRKPEWVNFSAIMSQVGREPALFIRFLMEECNLKSVVVANGERLRVDCGKKGDLKTRLRKTLEKFVQLFVRCQQCGSLCTEELHGGSSTCHKCKATFYSATEAPQLNIPRSAAHDPECRYKMPPLKVKVQGARKMIQTIITNLEEVSNSLCCDPLAGVSAHLFRTTPETLLRFFSFCLNTNVTSDCSVSGAHTIEQMQELVWTYIDDFVCCPECHKPEAILHFEDGELCGSCQACKARIRLNPAQTPSRKLLDQLVKEARRKDPAKKRKKGKHCGEVQQEGNTAIPESHEACKSGGCNDAGTTDVLSPACLAATKARDHYEVFHGLPSGTATLAQVASSSAGINGGDEDPESYEDMSAEDVMELC
jgi:translation initiation factor 2 subunit 3